ncbi:MAG: JAB domain-containing protein [Candidatus Limousia pullorum]|nr:JAB domain-containing protein [Candidatus Limousia pullorum]
MAYKHEHGGHRERMKDKYIKFGLEIFEPHEVLEMILFYAVPRVDTNPLAHRLIDHFGSLAGVFDASISQLMDFGLSKNAAVFISMIPKISRIYIDDKRQKRQVITRDMLGEYFQDKFIGRTEEYIVALFLDAKGRELSCVPISSGNFSAATVPYEKIINLAILSRAKSVALAHNHPSGSVLPSEKDIDVTYTLSEKLETMSLSLLDHIIIASDEYLSICDCMARMGDFSFAD